MIELAGLLLVVVVGLGAILCGARSVDANRIFDFREGETMLAALLAGAGLAFFALIRPVDERRVVAGQIGGGDLLRPARR